MVSASRDGGAATGWSAAASMGAVAGAMSKTAVAPVERIRMLLQMTPARSSGASSVRFNTMAVLKEEGAMGLWRGNGLAVLRAMLQKGILFATQDNLRTSLGSDTAAGGLAGLAAGVVTYPLDLLRTRLAGQVGAGSLTALARDAVLVGGPLALFRGAPATLVGGIVFEGTRFGIFGWLERSVRDEHSGSLCGPAVNGALASVIAGNAIYPNDTVRRRLQSVGGETSYVRALSALVEEGGVRRLYRGFLLYNLKAAPGAAVQFATFHYLKRMLGSYQEARKRRDVPL